MKFLAGEELTIKLDAAEMVLGLRHKLVIPRDKIVDLVWLPEFNTDDLLLRIGGANIPGLLMAGNFRDVTSKVTLFVYLRHPKGFTLSRTVRDSNVLRITLRDYTYGEVIVSCEPDVGTSLMSWFAHGHNQQS
jgi:hypothetical protein